MIDFTETRELFGQRSSKNFGIYYSTTLGRKERKNGLLSWTEIEAKSIRTIKNFVNYIQVEVLKTNEPLEAVYKNKILQDNEMIEYLETTSENHIMFYRKYIQLANSKRVTKEFFNERHIHFEGEVLHIDQLGKYLPLIRETNYEMEEDSMAAIISCFKKVEWAIKAGVKVLSSIILQSAFSNEEAGKFRVCGDYKIINFADEHQVKSDHVVRNFLNRNILFVSENEKDKMGKAVLKLFDRLISYSWTEAGRRKTHFFGVATTILGWKFCCYVRSKDGKAALSQKNFLCSETIFMEIENQCPKKSFMKMLAQIFRGVLTKDLSQIIPQPELSRF